MKTLVIAALSLASASFAFGNCGSCAGDSACADKAKSASACPAMAAAGCSAHMATAEKADGFCKSGCCSLIASYETVSVALAGDNLPAAKAAAAKLGCFAHCNGDEALAGHVGTVAAAASLDEARNAFKAVSAAVIARADGAGDYFIMTCPMAAADWIQTSKEVANPYFGSRMLRCGSIKKTVTNT